MRPPHSAAVLACLALVACASARPPQTPLPAAYEAPGAGGLSSQALDRWWTAFEDPQLQHQMLGWSNPAPLDEPFNAELIEKHLEQVHKRLIRRRLGLMLDPVHTEDPTATADVIGSIRL